MTTRVSSSIGWVGMAGALALLFAAAQPVQAQADFAQALRDATILQGSETMVRYPNDTFYVAVTGMQGTGVQKSPSGGYGLGNGSYVITSDGEPTDCNISPEECRALLEEAAESGDPEPQAHSSTGAGRRVLMREFRIAVNPRRRRG